MGCIVFAIVWTIVGVNAPTWYNATHIYANSSHNSSHLKNYRCKRSFRWLGRLGIRPEVMSNCTHGDFISFI